MIEKGSGLNLKKKNYEWNRDEIENSRLMTI